jgi:magnesium-transporting ATPase (P-type)
MGRYHFEGLTDQEVNSSRARFGTNGLPPPEVETFWEKLVDNFKDPLIKILCVALGVTWILALFGYTSWLEGIGIAVAVFIATFVSTYSEHKNEESFQRLQQEASRNHSNVFRFVFMKT